MDLCGVFVTPPADSLFKKLHLIKSLGHLKACLFLQDKPKDCHVLYEDHTTPHGATTYNIICEDEYKEEGKMDYTTVRQEECNNECHKECEEQCKTEIDQECWKTNRQVCKFVSECYTRYKEEFAKAVKNIESKGDELAEVGDELARAEEETITAGGGSRGRAKRFIYLKEQLEDHLVGQVADKFKKDSSGEWVGHHIQREKCWSKQKEHWGDHQAFGDEPKEYCRSVPHKKGAWVLS